MSLSKVVTEKRKEIDKLVKSLPAFKKECNELEKQILSLNGMHNFYEKKETEEKLKQLQSKIIDIESGNIRKTFEAHIQPYLIAEKKRKKKFQSLKKSKKIHLLQFLIDENGKLQSLYVSQKNQKKVYWMIITVITTLVDVRFICQPLQIVRIAAANCRNFHMKHY